MDVLWRVAAPASVRAVHTELALERDLAYTTVLTVLDRLARKGTVTRVRQGRQWLYTPVQSRVDLVADEVMAVLGPDDRVRQAILLEVLSRLPVAERSSVLHRSAPPAAS